jgi:peptidylprolyl isomerase
MMMTNTAQPGAKVRLECSGRLPDGTQVAGAPAEAPLEFTVGAGEVIPGLEEAVLGMAPGETKNALIPANKAFGGWDPAKCLRVDREQFPAGVPPEVGKEVELQDKDGKKATARVQVVSQSEVTLDLNHPLAGKDLEFTIKLLELASGSEETPAQGV